MLLNVLRGFGLWLFCLIAIVLTTTAAYYLGLTPTFERRSEAPIILIGFALGGILSLLAFIAFAERLK